MKQKITAILYYELPALLWMGIIFYLSAQPGLTLVKESADVDAIVRKFGHLFEFGFLAFLFYRIAIYRCGLSATKAVVAGAVLSLAYAVSDEYHQTFVFMREGTLRDWCYDASGVIIFLLFFYLIKERKAPHT
jgi:VanZ family protein